MRECGASLSVFYIRIVRSWSIHEEVKVWFITSLTSTTLLANSADDKLMIFLFFPLEKICMKCHHLFSEKKNNNQDVICWNVYPARWAFNSSLESRHSAQYDTIWQVGFRASHIYIGWNHDMFLQILLQSTICRYLGKNKHQVTF